MMASLDELISQVESPWSTYYGKHVPPGTFVFCVCSPRVDDINIGNISLYGVDPDGPVASIETEKNVSVPESAVQLTDNQADDIKRLVSDPWQMIAIIELNITLPLIIIYSCIIDY